MMKVEKVLCDIRDCPREAAYRVSHVRLSDIEFPTFGSRKLVIDLCLAHAEAFRISGTGAWTSPPIDERVHQ